MIIYRTQTRSEICGTKNAWSIESETPNIPRTETLVNLKIQGTDCDGFHLVMSPDGFFTADDWYKTIDEAFEAGLELFSVAKKQWIKVDK